MCYGDQETFYRQTLSDICNNVLQGATCTSIVYGGKGSGKTFTLIGAEDNGESGDGRQPSPTIPQDAGLVPRCLHHLYSLKAGNITLKHMEVQVRLQRITKNSHISKQNTKKKYKLKTLHG